MVFDLLEPARALATAVGFPAGARTGSVVGASDVAGPATRAAEPTTVGVPTTTDVTVRPGGAALRAHPKPPSSLPNVKTMFRKPRTPSGTQIGDVTTMSGKAKISKTVCRNCVVGSGLAVSDATTWAALTAFARTVAGVAAALAVAVCTKSLICA
jgi:hypothetical protein